MAHQQRFQRRSGVRRGTNWLSLLQSPDNAQSVASDGATIIGGIGQTPDSSGKSTIIRIRGCWAFDPGAATSLLIGLGIALITDQSFTAGIASVPKPITDEGWDGWMWRMCRYAGTRYSNEQSWGEIDSKAMRKWDDGETLVVVAENLAINVGGAAAIVSVNGRFLVKGP